MTDWEPPEHWRWRGRMPGALVDYDHEIAPVDVATTRQTWVVHLDGPMARAVRPVFARLYNTSVDRTIPRLQTWIKHQPPVKAIRDTGP